MEIAFWAAGRDGSSWYRTTLPADALRWRGHRVWADTVLPATVARRADVIVGSRVALPAALERWAGLKQAGRRLVLDLDDDYFNIHPSNDAAHEFWNRPEVRYGLTTALQMSDRVIVASGGLAHSISDRFPDADVRVVGNALPAQLLQLPRDYRTAARWTPGSPFGSPLAVGWSGSSSTATALPEVARALNKAANYRDTAGRYVAEVRMVGVDGAGALAAGLQPSPRVKTTGWIDYDPQRYLSLVSQFDIWVAPYEDTPFNRAKFATKALEAGFFGIPLVVSDIEPYRRWIDHGKTGFLVRQPHEWTRYIKQLLDSPQLRQEMGTAARAAASAHILQDAGEHWEQALMWLGA